MAYTLNRRLAQLVDSNGQLNTGKIPNDYITGDHIADNTITSAMLHTTFTVSTSNLTAIDTDDVSEGTTNLYYTNARVDTEIDSYLSGGTGVTYSSGAISIGQDVSTTATPTFGNITTTGYIAGPATFTIDPAAVGNNTGTVVIAGNLQVDGTTTTINSTTMSVDDLNITLASGAANAAAADGAGITVDGASATLTYVSTGDSWAFNKDLAIGVNDTTSGALAIYGGATGNAEGGEIRLHTAADHDTTYDHYRIDVYQDDLRIGRAGTTDLQIYDTGRVRVEGNFETGGTITSGSNVSAGLDTVNDIGMQLERGDSAVTTLRFDSDRFRFYSAGSGGAAEIISIREGGHVGLGTNNNTDARLHIQGNSDNGDSDCQLIIEDTDTDAGSQVPSIQFMANGSNTVRMRGTDTQGLVISGSSAQGDDLVVQAGAVGIGTTSPSTYNAQLVSYKAGGSFAYLGHSNTGGTFPKVSALSFGSNAVSYTHSTNGSTNALTGSAQIAAIQSASSNAPTDMAFYTTSGGGVAERMRIDSDGNIGIGTDNPGHKLEVITGGNTVNVVKIGTSTSENEKITLGHFSASITNGLASILAGSKFGGIIQGGENGKLVLGIRDNDDSDSVDIVSGSGNYMTDNTYDKLVATFRANGNVGIGVHPQAKLDVNGTLRFTPNTADTNYSADILARYDSTHPFELSVKNNGSSAEYMGVYANSGGGSERVVFPTGYVGIGTTSIVNNAKVNIVGGGINIDTGIVGANVSDAFTFRGRTQPHYGANFSPSGSTGNHIAISGYYGMSFATSGLERLTILGNGKVGIGQDTPAEPLHVKGTIRHQATSNAAYYANRTYLGDTFTFGTSETNDNVDFKIAGGAFTRTTTGGKFRFYTQTGNGTPSERMSISGPGTVHTPVHAQGAQSTGQTSFEPPIQGYLGDDLVHGLKAIYYLGTAYSSASNNAQSNYFNIYQSGHWGQYTQVLVWMVNVYFGPGFAKWHVNTTTVTQIESWGAYTGNVSVTSTLVGNGTHGGQSVYRYNVTLENPGTYHTTQWYVGLIGGGTAGHLGNSRTIAQADSWFSTRGGGLHLINCADTYLEASPLYSTGT